MRLIEGEKLPPPAAHGTSASRGLHPEWLFALFFFALIGFLLTLFNDSRSLTPGRWSSGGYGGGWGGGGWGGGGFSGGGGGGFSGGRGSPGGGGASGPLGCARQNTSLRRTG